MKDYEGNIVYIIIQMKIPLFIKFLRTAINLRWTSILFSQPLVMAEKQF